MDLFQGVVMEPLDKWKIIADIQSLRDPGDSLLFEETLLNEEAGPNLALLYENDQAVVIGKNQNLWEEVNTLYCERNDIPVLRRVSGGGTVFHGKGNLIISFLENSEKGSLIPMSRYNEIIINILSTMGFEVEADSRNALFYNGKKISGNAQTLKKGRTLSHATLLVFANLEKLKPCINSPIKGFTSKSIPSVSSPVGNICNTWEEYEEFKKGFLQRLRDALGAATITNSFKKGLNREALQERLFNQNPPFSLRAKLNGKDLILNVEKGRIQTASLEGAQDSNLLGNRFEQWLEQNQSYFH